MHPRFRPTAIGSLLVLLSLASPASAGDAKKITPDGIIKQQTTIRQRVLELEEHALAAAIKLERSDKADDKAMGKKVRALLRSEKWTEAKLRSVQIVDAMRKTKLKTLADAEDAHERAKMFLADLEEIHDTLRLSLGSASDASKFMAGVCTQQRMALLDLNLYHAQLKDEKKKYGPS